MRVRQRSAAAAAVAAALAVRPWGSAADDATRDYELVASNAACRSEDVPLSSTTDVGSCFARCAVLGSCSFFTVGVAGCRWEVTADCAEVLRAADTDLYRVLVPTPAPPPPPPPHPPPPPVPVSPGGEPLFLLLRSGARCRDGLQPLPTEPASGGNGSETSRGMGNGTGPASAAAECAALCAAAPDCLSFAFGERAEPSPQRCLQQDIAEGCPGGWVADPAFDSFRMYGAPTPAPERVAQTPLFAAELARGGTMAALAAAAARTCNVAVAHVVTHVLPGNGSTVYIRVAGLGEAEAVPCAVRLVAASASGGGALAAALAAPLRPLSDKEGAGELFAGADPPERTARTRSEVPAGANVALACTAALAALCCGAAALLWWRNRPEDPAAPRGTRALVCCGRPLLAGCASALCCCAPCGGRVCGCRDFQEELAELSAQAREAAELLRRSRQEARADGLNSSLRLRRRLEEATAAEEEVRARVLAGLAAVLTDALRAGVPRLHAGWLGGGGGPQLAPPAVLLEEVRAAAAAIPSARARPAPGESAEAPPSPAALDGAEPPAAEAEPGERSSARSDGGGSDAELSPPPAPEPPDAEGAGGAPDQ
eukprot:TRINITY_DN7836_c4_g1_i1.p1 TRINITY_DN7836_c4_g1~~TRINITY_DN7836_c4_g1_i1.p1  ORF type:complete len:627 (+),score=146.43 TRINITY_DN7836_c4_g1_i1:87-1883(+)